MGKTISVDGIKMRVVSKAKGGNVSSETLFRFSQNKSVVYAEYAGGKARLGFLLGTTLSADRLRFRYAQVDVEGRIDGGSSQCEVQRLADGRIRLLEHFRWDSRAESGTNVLEELSLGTISEGSAAESGTSSARED